MLMINYKYLIVLMIGLCNVALLYGQTETIIKNNQKVEIVKGDGLNMVMKNVDSQYDITTTLSPKVHNWFAGQFKNLPTDKTVTISLSLQGMNAGKNLASVIKWKGLVPVMTYADPTRYESYEWYTKDDKGRWVSSDPFKKDDERFAGKGKTPEQKVIPEEFADKFLSQDGKYWQPWRDVDAVEIDNVNNCIKIKNRYLLPDSTIAMRIPFNYTYYDQFITKLKVAKLPGITIDDIGLTAGKHHVYIVKLDDDKSKKDDSEKKTVLIYGREHATEHASSWTAFGALRNLISISSEVEELRKDKSWILIPIIDPDGAYDSQFDLMTDKFIQSNQGSSPVEVYSYAKYFADYIYSGYSIDLAVSLHNVEVNECPNVFSPIIDNQFKDYIISINTEVFSALKKAGYQVGTPGTPWEYGSMPSRLNGWCASNFGSVDIAYEINDCYPSLRLSLNKLAGIGNYLSSSLGKSIGNDESQKKHEDIMKFIKKKMGTRKEYLLSREINPFELSNGQVLSLGY